MKTVEELEQDYWNAVDAEDATYKLWQDKLKENNDE
jgi:hypothetical protein